MTKMQKEVLASIWTLSIRAERARRRADPGWSKEISTCLVLISDLAKGKTTPAMAEAEISMLNEQLDKLRKI